MFRWYKNAAVCYVYLEDAVWSPDANDMATALQQCRWFTRGWTLQELIAPRLLEFYASNWQKIGDKIELCDFVSSITGIDKHILLGGDLDSVSVARRMSWASHRKTSRLEDQAYCLLGLFDVCLPLIYGEGSKAFQRLQEAIMVKTYDQSIFAWGKLGQKENHMIDAEQYNGNRDIPWKPPSDRSPRLGLFAESPADFADSGEISPADHHFAHSINREKPPTLVNGGGLVNLVILGQFPSVSYWDQPHVAMPVNAEVATLLCHYKGFENKLVALILYPWGDGYFCRSYELVLVDASISTNFFSPGTKQRHILPPRPYRVQSGDIVLRRWEVSFARVNQVVQAAGDLYLKVPGWRRRYGRRVFHLQDDASDYEAIWHTYALENTREVVALKLCRALTPGDERRKLCVAAFLGLDDLNYNFEDWDRRGEQTLRTPEDTWICELNGRDMLIVKAEEMPLECGGFVDVLDVQLARRRTPHTGHGIGGPSKSQDSQ